MPRRPKQRTERADPSIRALPPLLDRLIYAEEHRGESNRALALASFGRLALVTIPVSGVVAPADDEQLYKAIEGIARKELGYTALRDAIKLALGLVIEFRDRDAIEAAYNEFQSASDQTYFYAGLAFGVTLAEFSDSCWR